MKTFLPAQPGLRGPQGLPSWLARLPASVRDNVVDATFRPAQRLPPPLDCPPEPLGMRYPQPERFGARLVLALWGLLLKKLRGKDAGSTPGPVARPWLRRVVGVGLLLLAGTVRAGATGVPLL